MKRGKYHIVENKIQCRICLEELTSKSEHDFKWCKCHRVAVDGGNEYLKRCGELGNILELSILEVEGKQIKASKYFNLK